MFQFEHGRSLSEVAKRTWRPFLFWLKRKQLPSDTDASVVFPVSALKRQSC